MLSIIVCSKHNIIQKKFADNILNTVGVEYEIVHVDNSANKHSIFSAYNEGVRQSKYPFLCFVHEDVLFHSLDWGQKVVTHLQDSQTGVIGVVGSTFMPRVPAAWPTLPNTLYNLIQSFPNKKKASAYVVKPNDCNKSKQPAIVLDGLFLCTRKQLMQEIGFDESLTGFHGYDYDISLQSIMAGYKNYVIYDIRLEHFSGGRTDIVFFRNLILVQKKWEKHLPLFTESCRDINHIALKMIEKKKLHQLVRKMVRKGFELEELKREITYYSSIIGYKTGASFIALRVFLTRLFNSPKYLLKKNRPRK